MSAQMEMYMEALEAMGAVLAVLMLAELYGMTVEQFLYLSTSTVVLSLLVMALV